MSKLVLTTLVVASALLNEASAVVVKAPVRRRVVDPAVVAEVLKELPKIPAVNLLALPPSDQGPSHDEVYGQMSMLDAMNNFTKLASKSLVAQVGMMQQGSVIKKVSVELDGKSSLRGVKLHTQGAAEKVADQQSPSTQTAYVALHQTIEKINELMEKTISGDEVEGGRCKEEELADRKRCKAANTAITEAQAQATSLMGQIQEVTLSVKLFEQEKANAEFQKFNENVSFTDVKSELDQELATLPIDIAVCDTILDQIADCQKPAADSFLQVAGQNLQCKQCQNGKQVAEISGEWKAQLSKMSSSKGKEALKDLLGESARGMLLGVSEHVKQQPDPTTREGEECPMENEVLDDEDKGLSYKGCQTHTTEGLECLKWTANFSAKVGAPEMANHSYCRNPDPEAGKYTIWCFVSPDLDPLGWQPCLPVQPPHGFGQPSFDCDTEGHACKLTSDSCDILLEKFSSTREALQEAHRHASTNLSNAITLHNTEVEKFDGIITGAQFQIEGGNAHLSESKAQMHTELAKMKAETGNYNDARGDFMEHQDSCCKGKKERLSERCALEKVRSSVATEGGLSVYDCVLGEWEDDGVCFVVDPDGQQVPKHCLAGVAEANLVVKKNQVRQIESNPLNGVNCENTTQQIKCELELCPVDCQMDAWSSWSDCSAPCGQGTTTRSRKMVVRKQGEGKDCPEEVESDSCNSDPCDVDCELEPFWPDYDVTQCSKPCRLKGDTAGLHERIRGIRVPTKNGGKQCPDERLACNGENQQHCRLETAECNAQKICERNSTTGLVACNSKLDLLVMLDSSGSLRTSGWKSEVSAVVPMLRAMGPDVSANVMIWSGPNYGKNKENAKWKDACKDPQYEQEHPKYCGVQWLRKNVTMDKEELVADLEGARANTANWKNTEPGFMNSMTFSGKALEMAHMELASNGMGRSGVDKVVVLVIDGNPTDQDETMRAAEEIKATGAKLIILAIGWAGESVSIRKFLSQLVSDPKEDNFVMEKSFDKLINPATINRVLVRACSGIATLPALTR